MESMIFSRSFCFVVVLDLCVVCKFIFAIWSCCVVSLMNAPCVFESFLGFYETLTQQNDAGIELAKENNKEN